MSVLSEAMVVADSKGFKCKIKSVPNAIFNF